MKRDENKKFTVKIKLSEEEKLQNELLMKKNNVDLEIQNNELNKEHRASNLLTHLSFLNKIRKKIVNH